MDRSGLHSRWGQWVTWEGFEVVVVGTILLMFAMPQGRWFRMGRRWGPGKIPGSRKVNVSGYITSRMDFISFWTTGTFISLF